MRRVFTAILLFISLATYAQPKGFKALQDISAFKTSLAASNSNKSDISSDFKQVKNLSLLSEKISSKGKFYYKKEDKVRIEYTSPYQYLLVMNGNKLLIKDEQSTNKINTGNSKMMQSVNRIMMDCMRGTVFSNPDFKAKAYTNGQSYLLTMTPITSEMKQLFESIDVYFDKNGLDVTKLVMNEVGGDYTSMQFSNVRHNTSLNETLFKTK